MLNQLNSWCTKHNTFVVLSIYLLCFVHTLDGFNTLSKFDLLNTLLINILYFTDTLDKFSTLDTVYMFDSLDVMLIHFLCLLIHSTD